MKVILLGTGTSGGVPMIACDCPVCMSDDLRDKRLRSSVLLEINGNYIVIDTGPDFRQQMLRIGAKQLDAVVLTHLHKDHIAGLDDIRPFNYKQQSNIPVFSDTITANQLKQEFPYIFNGYPYPGIPQVSLQIIDEQPFELFGTTWQPIPIFHHKLPIKGFRIENFAYITDASLIPESSIEKLQNLDVLILNALRKEPHISHFNLEQALELVSILKPKKTWFTHISHLMGTYAEVSQELPPNVALGHDGLVIEI